MAEDGPVLSVCCIVLSAMKSTKCTKCEQRLVTLHNNVPCTRICRQWEKPVVGFRLCIVQKYGKMTGHGFYTILQHRYCARYGPASIPRTQCMPGRSEDTHSGKLEQLWPPTNSIPLACCDVRHGPAHTSQPLNVRHGCSI